MKRQLFALGLGCALAGAALAAPARAHTPADKFGRGLSNVGLGIMELPAQMVDEGRRGGPLYAMSIGFARGVGRFVTRELVGIYEVATFPAPVPRGYRPILSPEYPWELVD
jgi:putative exosortase-associated protein (TIGR04073 family)